MRAWEIAKQYAASAIVRQAAAALGRADRSGVIKLASILERVAPTPYHRQQVAWLRRLFEENHPATRLAMRLLKETNPKVRTKLIHNMLVNASWLGARRRRDLERREGLFAPYSLLISLTMRCNLTCPGCYSATYDESEELTLDEWDSVLEQAKELGTFVVSVTGGEPLLRADDLLTLAWKHNDVVFQVFTNATLVDAELVDRIRDVGNVVLAMSVEGFEEETDARRGRGVHRAVIETMARLRSAGCVFGFATCVTRQNADLVCTDEFIDFYIDQGCYLGWLFHYMPIGREPDLHLMATPEQRDRLRQFALYVRRTRPIFVLDFWNDGVMMGGCLSGGHRYVHINHRGDVEPCVFAHFAVDNLREKPLRDALNSPFFRGIRERKRCTDNPLRSCMIVDQPEILREVVRKFGARPTEPGAELLVTDKAAGLDEYARKWAELADRAWQSEEYAWARDGGLLEPPEEALSEQELTAGN